MLNVKDEYRTSADACADKQITVTAEQILEAAGRVMAEKTEDAAEKGENTSKEKATGRTGLLYRSQYHIRKTAAVAAACIVFFCGSVVVMGAGFAGYGPLAGYVRDWPIAEQFRRLFGDAKTAAATEKGYYYEFEQPVIAEEQRFRLTLLGAGGDYRSPKLMYDVELLDSSIEARPPKISLSIYTLSEEVYEEHLDEFFWSDGYALQDSDNPNLYHGVVRGAPFWIMQGKKFVMAVEKMVIEGSEYHTDLKMVTAIPEAAFSPAHEQDLNLTYSGQGITLRLTGAGYSLYETYFVAEYTFDGEIPDSIQQTERLRSLLADTKLAVDGKVYPVNGHSGIFGGTFCIRFDGVPYDTADYIVLKMRDKELPVKGNPETYRADLPNLDFNVLPKVTNEARLDGVMEPVTDPAGRFRAEFTGVGGEMDEPVLYFDIRVLDQKISDLKPWLTVKAWTESETNYFVSDGKDGSCLGAAERDEKDSRLYHAAIRLKGRAFEIASNTPLVIDIGEVISGGKVYETNLRFSMLIPSMLLEVERRQGSLEGFLWHGQETNCSWMFTETMNCFLFFSPHSTDEQREGYRIEFEDEVYLEADGREIPKDKSSSGVIRFYPINYDAADRIVIHIGGREIRVKGDID